MSRRQPKLRAASGKAFASTGSSAFGAFSSPSNGSNLSYLSEPPEFSLMSDANVVVSFKNLLKKDGTTKAKALEDLIAYVETHPYEQDGGTEEPILEAWVHLYPRISIDNSRRVRELSHSLQFELMKSARKRMEKYIPKIVASWLAGTFDRDRVVSRVATEGLSSFLTTPEKIVQFWKRCQGQILGYVFDAILETANTLSDERSTNADDAEAKYHRLLGGILALVLNLLQKLEVADLDRHRDSYDQFFDIDKVWASVIVNDSVVRKLSCQLVLACLEKRPDLIEADLSRISKVYIGEGLKSNQNGSIIDFLTTLNTLTTKYPSIWTSKYHGKRSPSSRLKAFLEKGSQGSNGTFWDLLAQLLDNLPPGIIPNDLDGSINFMKSLRTGVTSRDESRTNAVNAWVCYLSIGRRFMEVLKVEESSIRFVQETMFPLTEHYLHPLPDGSGWASGCQLPILIKAYTSTATSTSSVVVEATKQEWDRYKADFAGRIKNSLPGVSKDYEKSQKAIADEGFRWFVLSGKILEGHAKTSGSRRPIPDIPVRPSVEILLQAFKLLKTRDLKPFGAAATIEAAFKNCPTLFNSPNAATAEVLEHLRAVVRESTEALLASSCAQHILSSILLLGEISGQANEFEQTWKIAVESVLTQRNHPEASSALARLVSSKASTSLAHQNPELQSQIVSSCSDYVSGKIESGWLLFDAAIGSDSLAGEPGKQLAKQLTSHLTNSSGLVNTRVLRVLLLLAQKKPSMILDDEETHMRLMTGLLRLSERSTANAEVATLRALLDPPSTGKSNLVRIIQQNINSVNRDSLGVDTLVQQAIQFQQTLKDTTDYTTDLESILPDIDIWKHELSIFLETTPNPSLSITSSLGGSYFLVGSTTEPIRDVIKRDRSGCSIPGRMAMFTAKMLDSGFDSSFLSAVKRTELITCLTITAELTTDQLTVMDENKIWKTLVSHEAILDADNLISSSRKLVNKMTEDASDWIDGSGSNQPHLVHDLLHGLLDQSKSITSLGLYSARVLNELLQSVTEAQGFPSSSEEWLASLDVFKSSPSAILPAVAILGGLGETISTGKAVSNFCNRLVSDVAGADSQSEKSLATLVLLNAVMPIYELGELPVASNRLVFAVRQITSWLEAPENLDYRFAAEACRSLRFLLPCIKDVYGSYWERAVDFCVHLWTRKGDEVLGCRLPYIHASLRLMSTLESLEDPNDDLVDVLQTSRQTRSDALIELLNLPRDKETQPLEIVDGIICRQVEKLPLKHIDDVSDLYGLMAAESRTVQTAAFTVLHKALPAAQEQLSVDVLLDKKNAQLPDELLSLLLEAPTLDAYSDEELSRFPTPIRSYLLTWSLIFDAFIAASYKVRSDYADNLKAANYIGPLMDFIVDVLGHSAACSLNLDKANFTAEHIRSYDLKLADADEDERNMQWLLIHIFYLVMKFVPGLFRSWFMDCRSKQTKISVETWMARYFSPIIISETLDDVAHWAATQGPPADDEKELIVKVSKTAKEVTASYEVDELQAAIVIRIPPAFPFESVSVGSINRVAVSEKKWQSWIMTTQGVITFSGGSIIDGLTAFKRNVIGALKGQTECAICYSIISSDKKMPDKRCQTCKNLFHRTCLYKWFQSSNQNTCPLCRNPIDYLGADTKYRRGA